MDNGHKGTSPKGASPTGSNGSSDPAQTPGQVVRVAAAGDLHCKETSKGALQPLLQRMAEAGDVVVLCGDLTDHGLPAEAKVLADEVTGALATRPPGGYPAGPPRILAVLGNHDFESGQQKEVCHILTDAGITLIDGEAIEILGVGFAGAKGFAGGFGRGTLSGFGEPAVKAFVKEAMDEAMRLEAGLLRLRTAHKIAVLHYAPIQATVEGEPEIIFPWLGCSRLEEPINRYGVTVAVHGHAHKGTPEGKTAAGVPVYNVSVPVMRCNYPDRPPFRVLTVSAAAVRAPATPPPGEPAVMPVGALVETAVG